MSQMKTRIKRGLKRALERAGYHVERAATRRDFTLMYQRTFEALLHERLRRAGRDFFFIQIGANDGVSFDELHRFVCANRLKGIVIEPLRDYFEELCANYSGQPQVTPLNVALHRTAREIDIYRVDPRAQGLPSWAKGIASVVPDHHRKSGTSPEHIIREKVRCVTMRELIEQHGVTRIDYLQIDTEGYDSEILQMIDFDFVKPQIIKFEHQLPWGVMSRDEFGKCFELLNAAGYYLLMDTHDAVAYLP